MSKIWLVMQREYLTRVQKKSFLLTTLLVPVIIMAFYAAIILISISGSSDSQKIAVIDKARLLNHSVEADAKNNILYTFVENETESTFKQKYKKQGYSAFLYIPEMDVSKPAGIILHSPSAVSLSAKSKIEKAVNSAIEARRMALLNIDPQQYKAINSDISISNAVDSGNGERTSIAGLAYAISFLSGFLIYIILMIYGTMVMRGVMEEKTSRIAEVIISSVKPFDLMMGKIIGIGAVGLTQFAIWIVLIGTLQFLLPVFFPALFHQMAEQGASGNPMANTQTQGMLLTVTNGIHSLPILKIVSCFVFYFLGGYLMYASLFAAIGSVVSEDQQEAQQLVFPVMMPIILGFVIMAKAANDPDSSLAVFGSLFPLTSPIVMMGRITYGVPAWQLALSVIFLIAGFLLFTWLTAKIYRTGILMYGKKISWREMTRWALRKS